MKIDKTDMFWDEDKDSIYFCGDSFYGHWSINEFEEFIDDLNVRLEEIKNERIK